MLKVIGLAVALAPILIANTSALAGSKSAAEFALKTCLPAMDDLSNVEVLAKENNWTLRSRPDRIDRFRKSISTWDVIQGEDRFSVQVWIGIQDFHVCFVSFPNNDVNREEFLTFIPTTVHLTLISDTWFAQTKRHSERYEIKSDRITGDRTKPVEFNIESGLDAKVNRIGIMENFPPVPTSQSEVNR